MGNEIKERAALYNKINALLQQLKPKDGDEEVRALCMVIEELLERVQELEQQLKWVKKDASKLIKEKNRRITDLENSVRGYKVGYP